MDWALWALIGAAAMGWSDISVEPSRQGAISAPWQQSLAGLDRPSQRTNDTLRRYDLDKRFARDATSTLQVLEKHAKRTPDPEVVFALAELSFVEARRLDRRRRPEALDHYVDAVAYAFDYLFDPDLAAGRQPGDPRFRLAMDLYNGGLDAIIRSAKSAGGSIVPGATLELRVHGRALNMRVNLEKSPWKAEDIQELLLCTDFAVTGADLRTRTYQYGLGVPLIGVKTRAARPEGQPSSPLDRFYPPEMAYPLTAFLRPNSRIRDAETDPEAVRACTLYLIDPISLRSVVQGSLTLGIESDVTTPLAYMWSRTDLSRYRWKGFLRPGEAVEGNGLMLLRPFEPGKIPVVLVHGLMSSPLAWIPMINELLGDPNIQKRYQFMLYVYPTGVPVPIAASYLRDSLIDAKRQFDPNGSDPAFPHTVLIGHSMGGLLTHAMAVDSEDHFWHVNSYQDFDELIGPPAVLQELRHYTFFEALPFVERVIFLATPHRGSDYATGPIGRIGSSLIAQPDHYTALLNQLVKDNPDAFNSRRFRRLPTSIETLEVDSPVLMALLQMKARPGVMFHSVIGAKYPDGRMNTTDGVVPYRSSHLAEAASEKVVNSDHGVQKHPLAIQEVRRILLEHSGQTTPAIMPSAISRIAARPEGDLGGASVLSPTLTEPLAAPVDPGP